MYKDSKRELFYIVFISAVLHLIVLIIFLLTKLNNDKNIYKKNILANKKKKKAQVIFKQTPQKKPPIAKKPSAVAKKPKPKIKKKEKAKPKKQKLKKLTPKLVAGDPSLRPVSVEKPIPSPKKNLDKLKLEKKQKEPIKPTIKNKKEIIQPEQPQKLYPKKKILKESPNKNILPKQVKPSKPASTPKMTLADLAKGFMKHTRMEHARRDNARRDNAQQNNSNHLISVTGKNFGQATAEQLKHERYIKKLFDCIDVSFKLLKRRFAFTTVPTTDMLRVFCLVDLNTRGQIVSFNLVESSGNSQLDMFMKKVLHDASRSFPPVPSSFNTSIYSLPIQLNIPTATLFRRSRQQMST